MQYAAFQKSVTVYFSRVDPYSLLYMRILIRHLQKVYDPAPDPVYMYLAPDPETQNVTCTVH
jgi:hypothetical protein